MKTMIVYEYPKALPDIYRWASDLKVQLGPHHHPIPYWYRVDKGNETIYIVSMDQFGCTPQPKCDKLVLWGSFTKEDLIILTEYMGVIR